MTSSPEGAPPKRARPKTCGRCGAVYCEKAWAELEPAGTMNRRDVESLVVGWRDSTEIDLRRCGLCSTILARLVQTNQ